MARTEESGSRCAAWNCVTTVSSDAAGKPRDRFMFAFSLLAYDEKASGATPGRLSTSYELALAITDELVTFERGGDLVGARLVAVGVHALGTENLAHTPQIYGLGAAV